MENYKKMSHTTWQCKYHVIFIPKYRRKALYGVVRRELGDIYHRLANQKGCEIEEGHVMSDHVHMLISIPPKYAVSSVVGFIKGKSAIHVARHFLKRDRNYAGRKPKIFNTDQGSQFSSSEWTSELLNNGIQISMDGKGRWMDNVFIERLWGSIKYEKLRLWSYDSIGELRTLVADWMEFYNHRRKHQGLGYNTPWSNYSESHQKAA